MKMAEVRQQAKAVGLKTARRDKESLIREIQRAERNRDCFNRGESTTCGQGGCAWRADCR